jgi:hypothetical protein
MPTRSHRHNAPFGLSVTKDLTLKWHIRQAYTKSTTAKWDIRKHYTKNVILRWDIRKQYTKSLTLKWDIRQSYVTSLILLWNNTGGTGRGFPKPLDITTVDPKFQVLNRYPFVIRANLKEEIINPIEINGRLKDRYNGVIKANTNKFYKLNKLGKMNVRLVSPQDVLFDVLGQLKSNAKTRGIKSKLNFKPMFEMIQRNLLILEGRVETFAFEDTNIPAVGDPINFDREPTFQNPSSFVGLVTYFPDTQDMIVVLNGKPYNYCNVSQRIFDAFKGAGSPGAYYNREIKGILVCV